MSPSMGAYHADEEDHQFHKGVKHLCEKGITKVPKKYILPVLERPNAGKDDGIFSNNDHNLMLPVIDFAQLQGSNRVQALHSLSKACEEYGFFQLINHGISSEVTSRMVQEGRKFFELPFEERSKEAAVNYSEQTKFLYMMLVEATLESLGLVGNTKSGNENESYLKEFEDGSQIIVVNCYPSCPEPDLTLGMPSHSDYGFLTLLLQDELVKGLQIQHQGRWVTVEPIPNSFVVNVGDHLEIFSNGRYKSVLHRVLVNPSQSRISIASLHSLPFSCAIRPSPKLINDANRKRYKDTDFASFMEYITSCEHKNKNFLESRKLDLIGK
ncbi:hypothetical protein GH714_032348 [Hevea brasiliensis]|uniref:Fe2OG dioxygenase domain-containing protein n=1 Tax=Hevea brasiliensis TaxID=3981 RepID=A0A6A6L6I2_HEVBR|nr:hypothetical protein GH714_032348 [Hevea brasiliensis]